VPAAIVGAGERRRRKRLDFDGDSELLPELASKRRLRTLSRLHLAAWKFPKPGHGPAGGALLKQNAALAVHQRRRNHHECRNFLQIGGQRKDSVNATHLSRGGLGGMPDVGIRPMRLFFATLIRDTKAASAVEYALICAMIVLAMVAALNSVAGNTIAMWGNVSATVNGSTGSAQKD
jgi:pilus assembly protein Flp/PilA